MTGRCSIPPPPFDRTLPGTSLTYGHNPDEPYSKLFLIIPSNVSSEYGFFQTWAGFGGSLEWEQLPVPAGVTPARDASICYVYNPFRIPPEEKVLAVFGNRRDIWSYDVQSRSWTRERDIWGASPAGRGVSLRFGGFGTVCGQPVTRFYLIKGEGSSEFMVYNRLYGNGNEIKAPFPYWEFLAPFGKGMILDTFFYAGADMALWPPVPFMTLTPTYIYAMQGMSYRTGISDFFYRYYIPGNYWERRDDILHGGVLEGAAIVSHDTWGNLYPHQTDEVNSIMHCAIGGGTRHFDCYDVPDRWNTDAPNPDRTFGPGSDLVFGAYWWSRNVADSLPGIWVSFGNGHNVIAFYSNFPRDYSGEQSQPGFKYEPSRVTVSPNPIENSATFRIRDRSGPVRLRIYSGAGRLVWDGEVADGVAVWNRCDFKGNNVPPGVYFYHAGLETGKLVVR